MEIRLSVLIATTSVRNKIIKPLLAELNHQMKGKPVELIINHHETDNVGKKRNDLLLQSKGNYVIFIDSDDHISKDYISKILEATKQNSDCIGISGIITTNGVKKRQWHISKEYLTWHTKNGVYLRTTNHISPVKREIALQAMFPEISYSEDAEYSKRILPLLKTETIIKGNIYHYDFRSRK